MSNVVSSGKSLYKKVSSVVHHIDPFINSVHKVFKKVWGTTIGKVVVSAVAIWFGGWALGLWAGPSALFGGGAAAGSATAGAGSVAAGTAVTDAAVGPATAFAAGAEPAITASGGSTLLGAAKVGTDVASGLSVAQKAAQAAAPAAGGGAGDSAGLVSPGTFDLAAPTTAPVDTSNASSILKFVQDGGKSLMQPQQPGVPGFGSKLLAGIKDFGSNSADFLKNHPEAALIAGNAIAAGMAKTPEQQQRDMIDTYNRHLYGVGDIPLGVPNGRPLTHISGRPVYASNGSIVT